RTFSGTVLDLVERRMRQIAQSVAQALNCRAEFVFRRVYPPTVNHPAEAGFCAEVLKSLVGDENVDAAVRPSMGAEDFAFMLMEKPGCYVWIGNGHGDHRLPGHGEGP